MTNRDLPQPALVTLSLAGAVLLAAVVTALIAGIPIPQMTQDVAAIAKVHPLSGAISSAGILLWWTSASVWALLAAVQRSRASREEYRFALASALLSGYLALDDLFQFHEDLTRRLFGVGDIYVFAVLFVVVVWYGLSFRSLIFRSEASLFVLAVVLLSASVAVDVQHIHRLNKPLGPWKYLIEDGTKWLGIACWCSYAVRRSYEALAVVTQPAAARDGWTPTPRPPTDGRQAESISRATRRLS